MAPQTTSGQLLNYDQFTSVIVYLLSIIGALLTAGAGLWIYAHRSMLKKLDKIDDHLQPLMTAIEVHKQRLDDHKQDIEELKKSDADINKWLNNHDGRIQSIERVVNIIKG